MPNTFAYIVLFSWPLVAIVLFRVLPKPQALIWTILAGYLLLPERAGFSFPMIPAINKTSVPTVMALVLCLLVTGRPAAEDGEVLGKPRGRIGWLFAGLLGLALVTAFITAMQNADPVVFGPTVRPGLQPYDALNIISGLLVMLIPFLLAQRFLATPSAHRMLLVALVAAFSAYSLLILYEVRMSPQLSNMIYGFFPHSFGQHIRGDGFRPVVFLNHGLWLGILIAMAVLAACAMWRQALRERVAASPWLYAAGWLLLVLLLSRNLGATALAMLAAPIILFAPIRIQLLAAAVVAGAVLTFPMLRGAGLVPTEALVDISARINEDRASSLKFRFDNEDLLLDRAALKPLGGWGTWGRNLIYDPVRGDSVAITDGFWIIIIGSHGWLGYIARFGLLTLPIILLALRPRQDLTPATAGLALVLAVALIDLIPNATISPVTWLVAGALAGYVARVPVSSAAADERRATAVPRWQAISPGGPLRPTATGMVPPVAASPRHQRRPRRRA